MTEIYDLDGVPDKDVLLRRTNIKKTYTEPLVVTFLYRYSLNPYFFKGCGPISGNLFKHKLWSIFQSMICYIL